MSPQEKFSSSTPQNEFSAGSQAQRKPEVRIKKLRENK